MLKALYTSEQDIPEQFKELYSETSEGFVLTGIEDKDYKAKVDEFRQSNINLKKAQEEMNAKLEQFKGVDPEEYKKLKAQIEEGEEKKLIDDGKIEELLNQRTDRMRQEYADKIAKLESMANEAVERENGYKLKLNRITVDDAIQRAVQEVGKVRQGAMTDILHRAANTWTVEEDGKLVGKNPNGDILYGKDGKDPMSPREWATSLMTDASYLFESNSGGSARGSGITTTATGRVIDGSDKETMSRNIEAIARGEVAVR